MLLGSYNLPRQGAKIRVAGIQALVADSTTGKLQVVANEKTFFETDLVKAAPGTVVEHTMDWSGTGLGTQAMLAHCVSTGGGSCEVSFLSSFSQEVTVEWTVPSTPDDYELLITAGNDHGFTTGRSYVRVAP